MKHALLSDLPETPEQQTQAVADWWAEYYGSPTSLDPLETPVKASTASPLTWEDLNMDPIVMEGGFCSNGVGRTFRHAGWQRFRVRVARAVQGVYGSSSTLQRFCHCGESMWILKSKSDPTLYKSVPDNCHSRWCVPCYSARNARVRAHLEQYLDDKPVRFVTLTLKASQRSLSEDIDYIYKSFRALRQKPCWKNRVLGGISFLEVKIGAQSEQWHVHIHALTQGRYVPQADLSKAWLECTGDSSIVDIRLVKARSVVLRYVTKYACKSNGLCHEMTDDQLKEVVAGLKGRRTIIAFGLWKAWHLLREEPGEDWELVGHLNEVERLASQGDEESEEILDAFRNCVDPDSGTFRLVFTPDG